MYKFFLFLFLALGAQCNDVEHLKSTITSLKKKVERLEREQTSLGAIEARLGQLERKNSRKNTPDFYNCASDPCLNGASCVETGLDDGFFCVCPPTFYGLQCDQTLDDYSFLVSVNGFPQEVVAFQTILWDEVIRNPGGYYNSTTGAYTAPLNGLYEFVIQKRSDQNMGDFQLRVNGVAYMSTPEGDGFADAMQTAASTLLVPLQAGDEVTVINHLSVGIWGSDRLHGYETWYYGGLKYADRN